ncbi:Gfo/Idh/MocA family protein [Muriicola sp. Z0-33]|uniref:Gfo/Idh/MocA family protein n=1 Tax=Muriicola sp. Z0-33 TaxID=2816957 RepID=UPI002237B38C|nr:Gfo/Idh/MocA family oxidoreductase [Muriicola sp. Z0-33]MCW5515918.1 Gfo/Idh/MocA family oxidoreductase [Muriicola sp. Z0-33]
MDRRDFIIKGGLASAALGSSASLLGMPGSTTLNDTINIGIIGTGNRGGGLIPKINDIEGLNVAACCDLIPFRLRDAITKTSGKAKKYEDYRKLLEDKDIDAVLIATPFSTHSAIASDAIDAEKHVYCEKTMAMGYSGIQNLVDKVRNSDKIFQTGHQYHSSRLYRHAVALIREGKIGRITSFDCSWNRNGNWRRPVPSPDLERAINWRMYREYSGGLVAELCSHQIDVVNWILNEVPEKVVGSGGIDYWKDGRETYDNVHLIYTYPSGIKANYTSLTSNAMDGYQTKIMGDKGTIVLSFAEAWFYPEGKYKKEMGNVDGVAGATVKWEEGKGIPLKLAHTDPSTQALEDFKNNILNNTIPESNITSGSKAAACVQMGLDAMHQDKVVRWNEDLNI